MALATNFKSVQDIKVIIGTETTVGSGILHTSGDWYQLPMIAPPTIIDSQMALDVGSQQTGTYTPNHNQMKQRVDNPIWEIQLQFLGVPFAWIWKNLFKQNASPVLLNSDYTPPDLTHGATNDINEMATSTIHMGGARHNSANNDYVYKGCVLKSLELSHSIDSNGGFPVVTATFVTGYPSGNGNLVTAGTLDETVTTNDGGTAGSGWTDLSGDSTVHWTALTSLVGKHQGETAGTSDFDFRAYGYSLSISRDIQRVGYDSNNFPMSYEMVGGFDISGDITFKKDNRFGDVQNYFDNNEMSGFKLSNGSSYGVIFNGLVSDVSVDTGSPEIRNTVSFQGAGNPKITGTFPITSDYATTHTKLTSNGHGLSEGQRVTISASTSLDGDYYVIGVQNADHFTVLNSWSGGTETGTWTLHADSKAIVSIDL